MKCIYICEKHWFWNLSWVGEGNSKQDAEVRGGNSALSGNSGLEFALEVRKSLGVMVSCRELRPECGTSE